MKTKPYLLLLWGLIAATVLSADVTLLTNDDSLLIPDLSCRTKGKVIKVSDGDTVHVLDAEKQTHKIGCIPTKVRNATQLFATSSL